MRLQVRARCLQAVVLMAGAVSPAYPQSLGVAHTLAQQGSVDAAVTQTRGVLAVSPRDADAHELLCLLFRSVDHEDEAIHECEAARDLMPSSSAFTLELARTYGIKADRSGALTGMRMVGRIRDSFERAVQLDPRSVDALSDLGEFYVEAPGLVGGGLDRARTVLARLRPLSAARAHRLAGMIAAKAGDASTADAEFASELATAPTPEAYIDRAVFERRRKNFNAAEANALLALQQDTAHGADTIDAAQLLIDIKRRPQAAEQALREYLAHPQVSVVMPAARVHTMLGRLLQARGDAAGAHDQFTRALALAASYEPARKALRP